VGQVALFQLTTTPQGFDGYAVSQVEANMKITIYASSADAHVASALSIYARLVYPLAEVECLLSKTGELMVDQDEGELILNTLMHTLKHAKRSRHALIREDIK
jgi:hypothetical protein